MAKSGRQYADDVRELRAQGFDFPADRGYVLSNAANWNSGQKAAVTRAINSLAEEIDEEFLPDTELNPDAIEEFFEDSAGDFDEEWDDIDYFDFDEADDLVDEENDNYDETPS